MTQLLQKYWEWSEDRRNNVWHGSLKRPTMYEDSMDIKAAFDVARPEHTAKHTGDQNVHGWIAAASLREMARLEGRATFENVESYFPFTRCIRQGSVEALWLLLKLTMQRLWNVEKELKRW